MILENPVTRSFDIIRTTLLVGVLNTIKSNKGLQRLPLRVFELSDVALLDPRSEVGARNKRALAAVVGFANRSGFEVRAASRASGRGRGGVTWSCTRRWCMRWWTA